MKQTTRIATAGLILFGYFIAFLLGFWVGQIEGYRTGSAAGNFQIKQPQDMLPKR